MVVKTSLGNIRRPSTTLDQYKPSTAFMVVKTGIPNHYRYSTNFVVHRQSPTEIQNGICKHLQTTGFLAVKILPSFQSKPLQAIKWFCSDQNALMEHLLVFNKLCDSQNVYHHCPQTFNRLYISQNLYHDLRKALNRLCGISTSLKPALQ